jgi:hypothetical protein
MAFANTNDYITGRKPLPFPAGGEVVAVRFDLEVGTADLQLNDIGQIGALPAGCLPVAVYMDATDIDTGAAAAVFQVGILNAAGDDFSATAADGGAFLGNTGSAVNTAFYKELTYNGNAMALVTKAETDRKIGVKVATAPTTAAAGTIGVTVLYRAA